METELHKKWIQEKHFSSTLKAHGISWMKDKADADRIQEFLPHIVYCTYMPAFTLGWLFTDINF